ncbi:fimbria/pilus outer membrane usher protein [Proteus terrae]|uniref:fimbria/pilus outer membrane usher protein n=1 Tax=Proteus terrae TaxID=1574161 RepID=UPI0022481BB1|nr:fimbria/pilus outer membrane usher protein [Proteus terrae]MCW9689525.1 fimbrial biogenesis outer membrane usher protein [Proteus terrae]
MSSYILKTIIISAGATFFLVAPYTYAENITVTEKNKWLPNSNRALSSVNTLPAHVATQSLPASINGNNLPTTNGNNNTATTFNPIFMNTSQSDIDISRFDKENSILPGTWDVDVYVNNHFIAKQKITFREMTNQKVEPCLTKDTMSLINIKDDKQSPLLKSAMELHECIELVNIVPSTAVTYDPSIQRLNVEVPQALVGYKPRGYVSPSLWDRGINALLVNYNANYFTSRNNGTNYDSAFAGIDSHVNLGTWSFHHTGNYSWDENNGHDYTSTYNYLERIITTIRGVVQIGDVLTTGQLFDSQPLRGIQLFSDEKMLPDSQRGFAPTIRGIAKTNARVIIRQDGRVIHETVVSPGPFEIDDLYPSGYGGNLDVTIQEADGSQQNFKVYYASLVQLLRPEQHNYTVAAGHLNSKSVDYDPTLYQATYRRGLTNIITGYAGVQGTGADYYAVQVGLALSTPLGAFSADVTQARVHLNSTASAVNSGQSYQISYSKYIQDTNSNLTIAAYKFNSENFYDYTSAVQAINEEKHGRSISNIWRPKSRFNVTIDQGLAESWGNFYLTGYTQNYWNNDTTDLQYQFGYNNNWRRLSYGLNVGQVRNAEGKKETTFEMNFTLPLYDLSIDHMPTLTAAVTRDGRGYVGERLGISGSAGADNRYSYGVTAMNTNHGIGSSMTMSGNARTNFSSLSATYGIGEHYQNASVGASGSLVGWSGGLATSPYQGNTFTIVDADGAERAAVSGYPGIEVNSFGYALVPYLTPYQLNDITINPKNMTTSVELQNTQASVAPFEGAITKVVFETDKGMPLLITIQRNNGPIPFGSVAYDEQNSEVGSIGQGGLLYARVKNPSGRLTVKWGPGEIQQCTINYSASAQDKNNQSSFVQLTSVCGE